MICLSIHVSAAGKRDPEDRNRADRTRPCMATLLLLLHEVSVPQR